MPEPTMIEYNEDALPVPSARRGRSAYPRALFDGPTLTLLCAGILAATLVVGGSIGLYRSHHAVIAKPAATDTNVGLTPTNPAPQPAG
jgi:hypothetical protein